MTTSSLLAEHTERSRLEDGIRAYELLLLKIDGDRIQVEVQLAETQEASPARLVVVGICYVML